MSDTVGTPEGDNEFAPDVPLKPLDGGAMVPPGSAPAAYRSDNDAEEVEHEPKPRVLEVIDELSRGRMQT